MTLSPGPGKLVEVKLEQAMMAERTTPGPATPTQLKERCYRDVSDVGRYSHFRPTGCKELKYTMGQMLNAQRTAALALVTPNLSCLGCKKYAMSHE